MIVTFCMYGLHKVHCHQLPYTKLYCTKLHYNALHYTTLHCTALCCSTVQTSAQCTVSNHPAFMPKVPPPTTAPLSCFCEFFSYFPASRQARHPSPLSTKDVGSNSQDFPGQSNVSGCILENLESVELVKSWHLLLPRLCFPGAFVATLWFASVVDVVSDCGAVVVSDYSVGRSPGFVHPCPSLSIMVLQWRLHGTSCTVSELSENI